MPGTNVDNAVVTIRPLGAPSDLGWVVMAHGEIYAAELGWDVGCVLCVSTDEHRVAQLRTLLVDPRARGRAIGSRLVLTALEFATAAGYTRMQLWTNRSLTAARHIYLEHGFRLTSEEPHHSFGADLIGETYERSLRAP